MRFPKILVLILNYNGKADTLECLTSLSQASPKPRFSILVVDNGSRDDSVSAIRAAFPEIPILETKKNLGFAGGNNAGLAWALDKSFEWIFLLNNDTIVAPDLIEKLMQAAQETPSAKILGAKIFRYHDPQKVDHAGGFWDPRIAEFVSNVSTSEEMQKVDYVCGCALLMHRSVPETIGLLEEKFFLLWEESDFCFRARRAGFEIWTAPQAKIWHKVSASFTGGKPHMHYFWWRNRLLWIHRNCSQKEKRSIYLHTVGPEILKCIKHALMKTLQVQIGRLLRCNTLEREQKAKRYRAGVRGIFHYFMGRFGNCPSVYTRSV